MKKAKKYTLFSLIPFVTSAMYFLCSILFFANIYFLEIPELFSLLIISFLNLFVNAPQIAIACNILVVVLQAKSIKHSKKLLWLNILLLVLATLSIFASVGAFIAYVLHAYILR